MASPRQSALPTIRTADQDLPRGDGPRCGPYKIGAPVARQCGNGASHPPPPREWVGVRVEPRISRPAKLRQQQFARPTLTPALSLRGRGSRNSYHRRSSGFTLVELPAVSGVKRGFTLVELMISIAIALVLIVGVNQVFRIAAQTVGAGQALSAITRDERVAHFTFTNDIHNTVSTNTPAFIISSQRVGAFRNAADFNSSSTQTNPMQFDLPGGGTSPIDPTAVNDRSHRVDLLSFFASGDLYSRQTANDGNFVSPTTSNEAYIWYGMVQQPDNKAAGAAMTGGLTYVPATSAATGNFADWFFPGAGTNTTNPNNFYSSDWILGRFAMLFTPNPPTTPQQDNYITAGTTTGNPLAYDAVSTNYGGSGVWSILQSRYDITNSSISSYRTSTTMNPGSLAARANMIMRLCANPFVYKGTTGLSAASMAAAAPIFLRHCSQFIVEYAGDYLTQTNDPGKADDGTVTAAQGDGTVDYVAVNVNGTLQRQIRWYGFPRNTSGQPGINIGNGDVAPLADSRAMIAGTTPASFEYQLPNGWTSSATATSYMPPSNYIGYTGMATAQYICSWGTDSTYTIQPATGTPSVTQGLPTMLRITIALDDPNGRLAEPQIYEYVIDLQP